MKSLVALFCCLWVFQGYSQDALYLSGKHLKQLPTYVAESKNLKSINLLGNKNLCWKTTFEVLLQLPLLEEIKLSCQYLDSIPKELYPKITELDLSTNAN